MFRLEAAPQYLREFEKLSPKTRAVRLKKIELVLDNPYREKRLAHPIAAVFRVRFSDRGADKRLIYAVKDDAVFLLEIIHRKHGYGDLDRILRERGKPS